MTRFLKLVLICSCMLGSTFSYSQVDDVKQKMYNAKVNKSPAKEEILKIDAAITKIERYQNSSPRSIYESETNYKIFVSNCEIIKELIPKIKEKDPKWKIEKQEEIWNSNKGKYNEVLELQKKYEELKQSFETYDTFFKDKAAKFGKLWNACGYKSSGHMDMTLEARDRALHKFEKFVFGSEEEDLQWELLNKKISEFQTIIETYKKEYTAKGGMERDIYSNALNIFTEGGYNSPASAKDVCLRYFSKNKESFLSEPTFDELPDYLISNKLNLIALKSLLHIFPGDKELTSTKELIENFHNGLLKKFETEIAQSAFHLEVIQGIYFSDHPVKIGEETAADFKTEFKSTDPIYVTIYYSQKYNNCFRDLDIEIPSTGSRIVNRYFPEGFREDCVNMTSVAQVTLIPPSFDASKEIYHSVIGLLEYLKDVKNDKIILEIRNREISIDMSAGNTKYMELYDQIIKYRRNELHPPKPLTSFSLSLAKACTEEGFNETIIKVIPTDSDWYYTKNVYGVILSREINAVVLFKDANGKCFLRDVRIYQEKIDSGYASPVIANISNFYGQRMNKDQVILHEAEDDDYRIYCNCF